MLKKLLLSSVILLSMASQVIAAPVWENVGKTSTGETLFLDTNSVQTKSREGGWLFFTYRLTGDVETRQNVAKTASCSGGKLSSATPGWIVDSLSRKVSADSVGSQNLLQRVCQLGKNATTYSQSGGYTITDYVEPQKDYSNYVNDVNRLLVKYKNPIANYFTSSQIIEHGKSYCDLRANGKTDSEILTIFRNSINTNSQSFLEKAITEDYLTTLMITAHYHLCP